MLVLMAQQQSAMAWQLLFVNSSQILCDIKKSMTSNWKDDVNNFARELDKKDLEHKSEHIQNFQLNLRVI